MRLSNKVAIVTGAAGGIGKEIALLFAKEGAKVLATDIDELTLSEWVNISRGEGLIIEFEVHDVADIDDWTRIIGKTIRLFGHLDILVNNAGVFPPGATTESTTLEEWNVLMAINLTGPFLGTKLSIPHLRDSGGGSIINISSIAGMVGGNGPAYTASKGALRLLTKDQAVEFAKDKIRVNSIHPGGVLTPMTAFLSESPEAAASIKSMCPMERIGTALEIAYGALYLASDESSYTTGAELVIDGGLLAR